MTLNRRLIQTGAADFSRPVVDLHQPIRCHLDGREISGYAGDSVLSAAIANGIDTAGMFRNSPVALDTHSAPPVALKGNERRPDLAMPMALCPAIDGARYVTRGRRMRRSPLGQITQVLRGKQNSLDLDLNSGLSAPVLWMQTPAAQALSADIVVIGGGIAGLAASLEAAKHKASVILVDRNPTLGGIAALFGKVEGQMPPAELIADLTRQISDHPSIAVFSGTEVFEIADGTAHAIRTVTENGAPRPERLAISGKHIVMATGTEERLPVFPGNRLPGVMGSGFAWSLAAHYGIWPRENVHLHTLTGAGYRLALLGTDSGQTIKRISDPRYEPQTRFIDYAKAYGFRLSWGREIDNVSFTGRVGARLAIVHRDSERHVVVGDPVLTDGLIISGGWQPALSLWLGAGGTVTWNSRTGQVVATGSCGNVVLAGSVAGFLSAPGCQQSGVAVIDWLLLGNEATIEDPQIDPMFETTDSALTVAPPMTGNMAPAFLSPGPATLCLPEPQTNRLYKFIASPTPNVISSLPRALSDLDLIGALATGTINEDELEFIARERCILPRGLRAQQGKVPSLLPASDPMPTYLIGRFGSNQTLWSLSTGSGRIFDPGCLVFANSDDRSPLSAVGVIVRQDTTERPLALMAHTGLGEGDTIFVRDGLVSVPAWLGERF